MNEKEQFMKLKNFIEENETRTIYHESIDELISDLEEVIFDLKESKEEGKTHVYWGITNAGTHVRMTSSSDILYQLLDCGGDQ